MNTANLDEPYAGSWIDTKPATWGGVKPYEFPGTDDPCNWCEIRAAPDHNTEPSLTSSTAINGGPLCNGGSDTYGDCLYYASLSPAGDESDLNDDEERARYKSIYAARMLTPCSLCVWLTFGARMAQHEHVLDRCGLLNKFGAGQDQTNVNPG